MRSHILAKAVWSSRKSLHLTQAQLGQYAGCGALFIHELEKGKRTVRLDKLLDVLNVLGLQLTIEPGKQEDACQFLDRYPADKYNIAFADIAAGVTELCSAPIIEVAKLLRLKAFSYLIANGDLHAKNISIRTSPTTGRVELTPGYDLLTTLPYGDRQMALKLGSLNDNLKRKQFIEFGKRFAVKEAAIDAILDQICDVAPQWINKIGEIGFTEKKTLHLRQVMKKRLRDLA
jgi:serine/threonine-protein kinase HipA